MGTRDDDDEESALDKMKKSRAPADYQKLLDKAAEGAEAPGTLEIMYNRGKPDDEGNFDNTFREVVFEDANEAGSKKKSVRLLVSLKSVMALKSLCEQEFARVQLLHGMLDKCRHGYYKELIYLREQLIAASNPNNPDKLLKFQYVKEYEVYFFTPPHYVTPEFEEFLKDCIRFTHQDLIEQIYDLQRQLGAAGIEGDSEEMKLKGLIRKMGPGKLLRTMYEMVQPPQGTVDWSEDLNSTILELADQIGGGAPKGPSPEELEKMRKQAEMLEALQKKYAEQEARMKQLEADLAAANARADAEKMRADDLERRLREALEKLEQGLKGAGDSADAMEALERLRKAADATAVRIFACLEQLNRIKQFAELNLTPVSSPSHGVVHKPLEDATMTLEDLTERAKNLNVKESTDEAVARLQRAMQELMDKLKLLEKQLRDAKEAERRAREEAEKARAEAERLRAEAAANAGKREKTPPAPIVEKVVDTEMMEEMMEEMKAMKRREAELLAKIEELEREIARLKRRIEDLENQPTDNRALEKALAELEKLKAKLAASEEEVERLTMKLVKAYEKIEWLKEEVRKWKRKCGVVDDDEEDSDDEDLPDFLIQYAVRIRHSLKPRWFLLNQDARLSNMRRDYFLTKRLAELNENFLKDAGAALSFLKAPQPEYRTNAQGRTSRSPSPNRTNLLKQTIAAQSPVMKVQAPYEDLRVDLTPRSRHQRSQSPALDRSMSPEPQRPRSAAHAAAPAIGLDIPVQTSAEFARSRSGASLPQAVRRDVPLHVFGTEALPRREASPVTMRSMASPMSSTSPSSFHQSQSRVEQQSLYATSHTPKSGGGWRNEQGSRDRRQPSASGQRQPSAPAPVGVASPPTTAPTGPLVTAHSYSALPSRMPPKKQSRPMPQQIQIGDVSHEALAAAAAAAADAASHAATMVRKSQSGAAPSPTTPLKSGARPFSEQVKALESGIAALSKTWSAASPKGGEGTPFARGSPKTGSVAAAMSLRSQLSPAGLSSAEDTTASIGPLMGHASTGQIPDALAQSLSQGFSGSRSATQLRSPATGVAGLLPTVLGGGSSPSAHGSPPIMARSLQGRGSLPSL